MLQIVCVKWGSGYDARHVNGLFDAIKRHTQSQLRFVLVTDDGKGINDDVVIQPFPDLGVPFELLTKRSCFGKLSIFAQGVLRPGVKTLLFDLDTAIFGDVAKLAACLEAKRAINMLPNHYVKHWRLRGLIKPVAPNAYYFANSSVIAFYPEDYHWIAEVFSRNYQGWKSGQIDRAGVPRSALKTDERFISYVTRDTLRVFPSVLAARFQDTYMTFAFWASALQDRIPAVRRRRTARVVLTFSGEGSKPARLAAIAKGDIVERGPWKTRWNYPELKSYWARLVQGDAT